MDWNGAAPERCKTPEAGLVGSTFLILEELEEYLERGDPASIGFAAARYATTMFNPFHKLVQF